MHHYDLEQSITEYEQYRSTYMGLQKAVCLAPFNSMCLNTTGSVGLCYSTYTDAIDNKFPNKSLKELLNSEHVVSIRNKILRRELSGQCTHCAKQLLNKNFTSVPINGYNHYPINENGYPSVLELEISNKCNLSCIMCAGNRSSSILSNRENKKPLAPIYDTPIFLEQLAEFIPHLSEIRFNGGEPLLSEIYFQSWELVLKLKPSILMKITTNCTTYSERFEKILTKGNCHLYLSIDALTKKTYEAIRVNASFERTMENLQRYIMLCKKHNIPLTIVTLPMRINWQELPKIISFANTNNIAVWLHNFERPENLAINTLAKEELQKIHKSLNDERFSSSKDLPEIVQNNIRIFHSFIDNQIFPWMTRAIT